MVKFEKFNVNPKGRKTGDCSTRALATTLGISYEQALKDQYEAALKYCYGITCKETVTKVLEKYGYVKMKQPRKWDNTKYTVGEIDDILPTMTLDQGVFISVANHYTCVKNGVVKDLWDCRNCCIGNYFVKRR